jgi:hypothetical protein
MKVYSSRRFICFKLMKIVRASGLYVSGNPNSPRVHISLGLRFSMIKGDIQTMIIGMWCNVRVSLNYDH